MPITLPTLLVTNNNDGTATFTISGSEASNIHTVKYAKTTDLAWINIATINGNASSGSVTMQTGTHWFSVSSVTNDSAFQCHTSPIMACITLDENAVYKRIIDTVIAELQTLATAGSLPGLDATKIARQDALFISNLPFDLPGIAVAPGANEEDRGGTNERDDLGYPVMVVIVDSKWSKDPDPDSTDIDYFLIRERIRRHFQNRRLASVRENVPESYTTKVSYESILDHHQQEKGLMRFGSYLTLNFYTREPRGA